MSFVKTFRTIFTSFLLFGWICKCTCSRVIFGQTLFLVAVARTFTSISCIQIFIKTLPLSRSTNIFSIISLIRKRRFSPQIVPFLQYSTWKLQYMIHLVTRQILSPLWDEHSIYLLALPRRSDNERCPIQVYFTKEKIIKKAGINNFLSYLIQIITK